MMSERIKVKLNSHKQFKCPVCCHPHTITGKEFPQRYRCDECYLLFDVLKVFSYSNDCWRVVLEYEKESKDLAQWVQYFELQATLLTSYDDNYHGILNEIDTYLECGSHPPQIYQDTLAQIRSGYLAQVVNESVGINMIDVSTAADVTEIFSKKYPRVRGIFDLNDWAGGYCGNAM